MKKIAVLIGITFLLIFTYQNLSLGKEEDLFGYLTSTLTNVATENDSKENKDKLKIDEKDIKSQQKDLTEKKDDVLKNYSSLTTLKDLKAKVNKELSSLPKKTESSYGEIKNRTTKEVTIKEEELKKYINNKSEDLSQEVKKEICREICGSDCDF